MSVRTLTFPFHGTAIVSLSSGVGSFALSPAGMAAVGVSRPLAEADNWAHFRVRKLSFRVHKGSISASTAVGFCGGVQDNVPATQLTILELLPSTLQETAYTVPSNWVHVEAKDLAGPLPWYKSVPGAADPTEEAPGIMALAGGTSDFPTVELVGVLEFKTPVAPVDTPVMRALRSEIRRARSRPAAARGCISNDTVTAQIASGARNAQVPVCSGALALPSPPTSM